MTSRRLILAAGAALVYFPLFAAAADPLPPGAIARLELPDGPRAGAVEAVAVSSDGKLLIAVSGRRLRAWDLATGKDAGWAGSGNAALAASLSPAKKVIAVGRWSDGG